MKNTTETYTADFNILHKASVGVILVQSREPHRTQEILHEQAHANDVPFKVWDVVQGWVHYSDDPEDTTRPKREKMPDAYAALKRINDIDNDEKNRWDEGYFVMHYPHWVLPKHPGFMQCLKLYARAFAATKQRVILLVPEGFSPPAEIQPDVCIMDFPLPSNDELHEALEGIIEAGLPQGHDREVFNPSEMETLVGNAAGMTIMEANNSFARAVIKNRDTFPDTPFDDFNAVLLSCKTDVVKRSEVLELMDGCDFDEVGGLELFKNYIDQRTRGFTEEARAFGMDTPKGFLLVGPPGTGKSLCAKATANRLGLPLIKFDISRVFGSLVGQSEERVRAALKQLDAMAPCVALLDEVDKGLGGSHQGGGDSGVAKRVLGAILTHMQESTAPVYWAFTANRANALPPELVRKGRLDEIFCITVPNKAERVEILNIHLAKRNQEIENIDDLEVAVEGSRGFVAAEIEAAVSEAVAQAFHKEVDVTGQLIAEQLKEMKPLAEAYAEEFQEMSEWAENNARPTSLQDAKPRRRSAPAEETAKGNRRLLSE